MENNNFVIENGVLKSYVGSDTCVSIPEGVTKVGKKAFSGKNKIKEVIFPQNSLKSIEADAFASCKSIKNLMLPKGLLQIGDNAFTDCAALEYVFIPDSVVLIGEDLFGSNHSVIILGETGSEAEKYANANLPKLPFSTNVSAISAAKKAPERKAQSKTFDIFGEDVKCSSTLSFFHNALEYYEYRKDVLFERVIDALPLEINADFSKILNVQNFLNQEDLLLIERIEKYGFIINKGEIAVHTAEASISMIEATKAIAEFYCQAIKYQQSTIQDQAAQLQQAAENSVKGLSYGILGNSFDMAIYALDDFRARQKQRREAYAKAESRLASFKEKLTTNIQREYVKTVSEKIPVIRQLTDNYITGLRNAEIVKLVDVGVLDRKAVDAIDLEKSSELLQKALDAKNDDKAFLIAKALEKYPCNCAAIAYAVEQGLTCDGLEQLIDFVGLQEKVSQTIASNAANRHAERYEKAAASLSSAAYQNRINALMNEEKVFSKEEIRNLLQIPIPAISSKLISATENPDISQEYTPEQYAKSKLYAILPEAQWNFYKKYDVLPLNGEKIPSNMLNTYADLLSWFQSKIQGKEDKYIRACKMLESGKNLSEARDDFSRLIGYKDSEKKLASTRQILKKKNWKIALVSITVIAILIAAICVVLAVSNNKKVPMIEQNLIGCSVTRYDGGETSNTNYTYTFYENNEVVMHDLSKYITGKKLDECHLGTYSATISLFGKVTVKIDVDGWGEKTYKAIFNDEGELSYLTSKGEYYNTHNAKIEGNPGKTPDEIRNGKTNHEKTEETNPEKATENNEEPKLIEDTSPVEENASETDEVASMQKRFEDFKYYVSYFENHLDEYPIISGDDLRSLIVGAWDTVYSNTNRCIMLYNADGTRKQEGSATANYYWKVDGDCLVISQKADFSTIFNYLQIRDVGEGYYIVNTAVVNRDRMDSSPSEMMIKQQ